MKKFKYGKPGTKRLDRYTSKIRTRKIEKCLSQLKDALRVRHVPSIPIATNNRFNKRIEHRVETYQSAFDDVAPTQTMDWTCMNPACLDMQPNYGGQGQCHGQEMAVSDPRMCMFFLPNPWPVEMPHHTMSYNSVNYNEPMQPIQYPNEGMMWQLDANNSMGWHYSEMLLSTAANNNNVYSAPMQGIPATGFCHIDNFYAHNAQLK